MVHFNTFFILANKLTQLFLNQIPYIYALHKHLIWSMKSHSHENQFSVMVKGTGLDIQEILCFSPASGMIWATFCQFFIPVLKVKLYYGT